MNVIAELKNGATELKVEIAGPVLEKISAYLALIAKWNRVHNLTAVRDFGRMVSVHALDSLSVIPHITGTSIVDVGSGAGLPGIPIALALPHAQVVLVESNHKKAAFLRQAVIELELKNVEVVCERVETWQAPHRFDLVISRAFSDLAEFVQLAGRLCKPEGTIAAMKGVYPDEELAQLPAGIKLLRAIRLKVPGLDAERHLIMMTSSAA